MRGKYFLDTNIFVYASISNEPAKKERSEELIGTALADLNGMVSYQIVQEFFNVALRAPNLMTIATADQYLKTVFRPLLRIYPSVQLFSEAMHVKQRYGWSWYDSLIVASALEGGCNALYTEDLQHGMRIGDLQIMSPFR
jgi:predicted nucleic acid-binding protein